VARIQERLPRHQTRRRRRRRKWRKVYYALHRTEALSDTPIRPSVCPSPRRAAALGYRYAGGLQLSHVRSADMSAEGRIDPPRVELSSAEGISSCRPGAITCFIGVVRTAAKLQLNGQVTPALRCYSGTYYKMYSSFGPSHHRLHCSL